MDYHSIFEFDKELKENFNFENINKGSIDSNEANRKAEQQWAISTGNTLHIGKFNQGIAYIYALTLDPRSYSFV